MLSLGLGRLWQGAYHADIKHVTTRSHIKARMLHMKLCAEHQPDSLA